VHISPYCRSALETPNFMKFGIRGHLTDVITCVNFLVNRFRGYGVLTSRKWPFPIDLLRRPYNSSHHKCLVTPQFWNGFFRDNFVIFRRSIFLEPVNFLRVSICNFSIFVMVTWPLFGTLHEPISAKCMVTDSAHLQFRLSIGTIGLVWGKTASCRLCAGQSKGTLKREKMLLFASGSAHATKFRFFSR